MTRHQKWLVAGLGLGGLAVIAVAGAVVEQNTVSSPHPTGIPAHHSDHVPAAVHHSKAPGVPQSTPPATAPLGTVAWAQQLQAALTKQWGQTAPPLWIGADPRKAHTWFAVAPAAVKGQLWWAYATPTHPLPRFQGVSTSLQLMTAQVNALPGFMAAGLNQVYDLVHDQPWPLTHGVGTPHANGVMTVAEAEANGTAARPVGWELVWSPAVPAYGSQPATPGGLSLSVNFPWQAHGYAPVLASASTEWLTTGIVQSGAVVSVDPAFATLAAGEAAMAPTTLSAGISSAAGG